MGDHRNTNGDFKGVALGEHGFYDKRDAFEESIRVPMLARGPGIKPGTVINAIFSQEDWMPTLLAAAGEPGVKEKLLKGKR